MNYLKNIIIIIISLVVIIKVAVAQEVIRFGTQIFFPPFVEATSYDQASGFDIEFANLLCAHMKVKCEFTPMSLPKMFVALNENRVDALIGSLTITPEREQIVNFTVPYLVSKAVFLGHTSLPDTQTVTINYLQNKKIGTLKGSIFIDYLINKYPNIHLTYLGSTSSLLVALNTGHVDMIYIDAPVAAYWVNQSNNQFKLIGQSDVLGKGLGIAVNMDNPLLLQRLNEAILTVTTTQEYKSLIDKYFTLLP